MDIKMDDSRIVSIPELREFLKVSKDIKFIATNRKERYKWINEVLNRFRYLRLKRQADKSSVKKYIIRMVGLSAVHLKRLIKKKKDSGVLALSENWGRKNTFTTVYGPSDIGLLVRVDNAHNRLNGVATKKILVSEWKDYHKSEFENLKNISVSRIYGLRQTRQYISRSTTFTDTDPVQRNIGERRKPQPEGKPGFLRVDSVHQGDKDGEKGVYFINLIDEVLQWELLVWVEGISEQFLKPALKTILQCFPFVIRSFHSDNGSEFINYQVAYILNSLTIAQTKSRSRKCNDNALVEGKNGSIVRKWFGRNHISRNFAPRINEFCQKYLNTYLNFHRPCGFATTETDKRGKQKKVYELKNYLTPYQKLKTLENWTQYLAPGRTQKELDDISSTHSGTDFAELMQKEKITLFKNFKP
jgi:transposase InsO family protein